MSAPPRKSRTPSAGPPPEAIRKPSNPAGARVPSSKFYDGPTVPASAKQAASQAKQVADRTAAVAKKQTKKAVATVKRHPWGFASLVSTIPFLIIISLFSTVLCPPPSTTQNILSKTFTSTLGLHHHSSLHEQLCYPANVYHREVLTPYVYPLLDKAQARAMSHPLYINAVSPAYERTKRDTLKLWNGPIKPVYTRISKAVRLTYLKFVQPHIPFLSATVQKVTSPLTSRISQTHNAYVAPHVRTAQNFAAQAANGVVGQYHSVANHPLTGHAGRYANHGYRLGRKKSLDAYQWSRPHAIRAGTGAERVIRETVAPRVQQVVNWGSAQAGKGWRAVSAQASHLYYAHLDRYLGPHISRANTLVSPYVSAFHKKIYKPYIYPAIAMIVPAEVLSPPTPKSFWTLIADILPSAGTHPAERKANMDNFYDKVDKSSKPASVPVPPAGKKAAVDLKELNKQRDAIRERVDAQGKKSETKVKEEILQLNRNFMEKVMPQLQDGGRGEIEREIEYILSGLDKLFSGSKMLTDEQVESAGNMALSRLQTKVVTAKDRGTKQKELLGAGAKAVVEAAVDEIDQAMGREYEDLKAKVSGIPDVSSKEVDKVNEIRRLASTWKQKCMAHNEGKSPDSAVRSSNTEIENAINTYKTYMTDLGEAFRERVILLKKTAHDRVEAREAVKNAPPVAASSATRSSSSSVSSATASKSAVGGEELAAEAIRYGKEKAEALKERAESLASAASTAIVGDETETAEPGYLESAKAFAKNAKSAFDAGTRIPTGAINLEDYGLNLPEDASPEVVKSAVAEALSKASDAWEAAGMKVSQVGDMTLASDTKLSASRLSATTNMQGSVASAARAAAETVASGVQGAASSISSAASIAGASLSSAGNQAGQNIESLMAEAMLNIHSATRSMISKAGATPSPEGASEHLASIANAAAEGAASVYGVVEEQVHSATREVIKAAGGTPSPEGVAEHAASIAAEVSETVASAGAVVTDQAILLGSAIQSYLGVAPTPAPLASSASAYLSSLSSAGSSAGADMLASGSILLFSLASEASYAASAVGASASSIATEASSTVHSATRAAAKAAGVSVTPETPGEYVEDLKDRVVEAAEDVADKLGKARRKVKEAVVGRDEL